MLLFASIVLADPGLLLTPPQVTIAEVELNQTYGFNSWLTNTGDAEDTYTITLEDYQGPADCATSMCIGQSCLPPEIRQSSMTLLPAASDTILVDFFPMSIGECSLWLRVRSGNDPSLFAEVQFVINRESGIGEPIIQSQPLSFGIDEVYPNPFNPTSQVVFTLPITQSARLTAYTIQGRQVATLWDGVASAGTHRAVLHSSPSMASGVYLIVLESGGQRAVVRSLLIK